MTEIPKILPSQPPLAIATYNYIDIEDGSGVVVLFGASHSEEGTITFFLSQNVSYSNDVVINGLTTSATAVKILDHDYDITFNQPRDMKGKVRAILSIGNGTTVAGKAHETFAIIRVRHWDGTTETEIANVQSDTMTRTVGANAPESQTMNVEIDVPTLQHFNRDETLRITVEIWGKSADGLDNNRSGYGLDPKDRNDPNSPSVIENIDTTVLEFHVPFRIDL